MAINILCVDDQLDSAEAIKLSLEFEGYRVSLAATVNEAMLLAEHNHYEAFILDIQMPDKSGLDLCRWIRATNKDIPIIIYSAGAYKSDIDEACLAGATRYLTKPTDIQEIVATVQELTGPNSSSTSQGRP